MIMSLLNKFLIEEKRDDGVDDCHTEHKQWNTDFFCTQNIVRYNKIKKISSKTKLVALTNYLQIDGILV